MFCWKKILKIIFRFTIKKKREGEKERKMYTN